MTTLSVDAESLISHAVNPNDIHDIIQTTSECIIQAGDKPHVTVKRQLELLNELSQFNFGKFLLQNQGINGYWTHYMLTHPWFGRKTKRNDEGEPLSELEMFLLDKAPGMLATQQRFEYFLRENQEKVSDNATLACIPCGMMGELLYLNFHAINTIQLIGIDYDADTLNDAKQLAEKKELSQFTKFIKSNAWDLEYQNKFDLISSNGLNIYESDDDKVTELYQRFHAALKPNGKLVTSFLTFPPPLTEQCEWDMSNINKKDLLLQQIIFIDIIQAKFRNYRSTEQTREQLQTAGFNDIQFIYDKAKMFPTVVAVKSA